ncbi:hypothetical protein [Microbacterium sp.]
MTRPSAATASSSLGEECDDGNRWNDDGCSRDCEIEPGPQGTCEAPFILSANQTTRVNLCGELNDGEPIAQSDCGGGGHRPRRRVPLCDHPALKRAHLRPGR